MAAWAARAIQGVRSMPILGGVRIEAGYQLRVSAFNFDNLHEGRVGAQITDSGEVLVPGLPFAQILDKLRAPSVEIFTDGRELVAKSGASEVRFHLMALEQYPDLPKAPIGHAGVDSETLAGAVESLAPLTARNSLNTPWTECVYINGVKGRGLRLYGGTRQAVGRAFLAADVQEPFECMLPARKLVETVKPFDGTVHLGVADNRLGLAANDQIAALRLFDNGYPTTAVGQIFLGEMLDTFKVPTADFRESVRLMAPAGDWVVLDFQPDLITLTSSNSDAVNDRATVTDAVEVDGTGTGQRRLDLKYLLPAVSALDGETFEIGLGSRNLMSIIGSSVEYVMATIPKEARAVDA